MNGLKEQVKLIEEALKTLKKTLENVQLEVDFANVFYRDLITIRNRLIAVNERIKEHSKK